MYEVFKNLIDSKGLKAADVCRGTGLPSSFFSEWKRGKSHPKYDKIKLIADYLGVTPEYLMTGEKPEPAEEDHTGKKAYYLDPEAADIAQVIHDNPDMRILFDAARDISPDQLKAVGNMVATIRKQERGDFDEPC